MAFSPSSSVSPGPVSHQDGGSPSIPQALWNFRVPLYITHKAQHPTSSPFITSVPRFSYLAQLLPRLSCFFDLPCSSFHHEGIQLRNLPVGLLVDLYQPRLPWRLELGDGDEWDIGDTFLNGVKEVSPLVRATVERISINGNARMLMIPCFAQTIHRPTLSETATQSKL